MSGLTQAPFARLPAPNAPLRPAGQPGPPDFRGFFPVNYLVKFRAVEGAGGWFPPSYVTLVRYTFVISQRNGGS